MAMTSEVSNGVSVTVESIFDMGQSNALQHDFVFAYCITLENFNNFPVQLISRHWYIYDSNGTNREVEGMGVIGKQPILQPGERFQYVSACNLQTEMGKMWGSYKMQNRNNLTHFTISIPVFNLIATFKDN